MPESSTFQRITGSGVIGTSGKAIDVLGYQITATGGGATTPSFLNGTTSGGATVFIAPSTATSANSVGSFNVAVRFGSGCFVNFDANTSAVTVFYIQTSS